MKEFLSHFSAAEVWDIPNIDSVLGFKIAETDLAHITLTKHNVRHSNSRTEVHSCVLALPRGAVVARGSETIASPELLFLELAGLLSIHRLILLGLQLCSHPPGCPSEAITTKKKLMTFLARAKGHRGYRKALRAVQYVENGSASVMESLAYMILTLPNALGGYGLNGAVFNHEIILKEEGRTRLGHLRCFTDLYYTKAKLAVEYESFSYHSSPLEQGKDAVRAAILERQGIDVMHLSTVQLYDKYACRDFACNLSSRIGKRISIRTKKFNEMHDLMRALLPDGQPV